MNPLREERKWQKIGRAKLLEKSLFTAELEKTKDYIYIKEEKKKVAKRNFWTNFFAGELELSSSSVS